jgi:hypothetical protein
MTRKLAAVAAPGPADSMGVAFAPHTSEVSALPDAATLVVR